MLTCAHENLATPAEGAAFLAELIELADRCQTIASESRLLESFMHRLAEAQGILESLLEQDFAALAPCSVPTSRARRR